MTGRCGGVRRVVNANSTSSTSNNVSNVKTVSRSDSGRPVGSAWSSPQTRGAPFAVNGLGVKATISGERKAVGKRMGMGMLMMVGWRFLSQSVTPLLLLLLLLSLVLILLQIATALTINVGVNVNTVAVHLYPLKVECSRGEKSEFYYFLLNFFGGVLIFF